MGNKKILLINSFVYGKSTISKMIGNYFEEPYPSIGLLYLASTLKQNNYDVLYLDIPALIKQERKKEVSDVHTIDYHIDSLVERIIIDTYNDFKPDVAGINCLFSGKFSGTIYISSILKKKCKSLPIVIGGIHPTVFHQEILEKLNSVDFVIIGEGELSITQLLDNIFFKKGSLSEIDGLCYRDGNKVIVNPKKNYVNNLDTLPIPAWELLDFKNYEIEQEKWELFWHNPLGYNLRYRWPLLTSRSCPMDCNFCAMKLVMGNKIRFRSSNNVFEEMKFLYNKYDINYFSIIDDNFTLKKSRVIELSEKIKKANLKIYIDTPNGVSMKFFDEEILKALKTMGLLRIYFAIESGSDYIRNEVMGKKLSKEQIYYVSDLMRNEKDIFIRAFFIIGLPQETKETLKETYDLIKSIYIDDVSIHYAIPFPGTRLYNEVMGNNLLTIPEKDILFADNYQLSSDVPFIKPYNLEIEELIAFKKKVEKLFNLRYKRLKILRKFPIHHLL